MLTPGSAIHNKSTQTRILGLLTAVNYLSYIDRFMLSALLSSIQKDLDLTDFRAGLLATAFMLAYILTAPAMGPLVQHFKRSAVLGTGVLLWSVASLLTGVAGEFNLMFGARFLLGLGESMFTTVAAAFLTDFFDVKRRGRMFAIFASAAPAGAAIGFMLGGYLGGTIGWRNSFYLAGIPGLALAFFISRLPEPIDRSTIEIFDFKKSFSVLKNNRSFVCAVLGYTAYTYVSGGLAHWMPTYVERSFQVNAAKAGMMFGVITVISGFLGTLMGGYVSDRLNSKIGFGHLKFSAFCMFLSLPFFIFSFTTTHLNYFLAGMAMTQYIFFLPTSPINVTILESVPAALRTMAMALAIFVCHVLGDMLSSPLIGLISDRSGSLRIGMLWCAPVIFLSALVWYYGARLHQKN